MKRFISKKTVAIGLTAGLILGVSGAAFAYFTANGSGTGNATVGATGSWDVEQTGSAGTIVPGTGSSTISYTVTNTGTADQGVNAVVSTIKSVTTPGASFGDAETAAGADIPGCLASWFSVSDAGHPTYITSVAGGATVSGTTVVTMPRLDTPQNACQGALPGVNIAVS